MTSCCRFERRVVQTTGTDPALAFVGGTPWKGDRSNTGIVLPETPTDPTAIGCNRYLVRCCAISVAPGARCILRSLRQMLTIGAKVQVEQDGPWRLLELDVVSPTWHFVDGAVSWHLMEKTIARGQYGKMFTDTPLFPPFTFDASSESPGILARTLPPPGPGYRPLNGGIPLGKGVGGLGSFMDIRFPWHRRTNEDLGLEVHGPCQLVLYASVYQTDPERRPDAAVLVSDELRPEDRFVNRYANARYHRIGAEMVVDLCDAKETRREQVEIPVGGMEVEA